jgi:adenylate cyclase
MNNERPRPPQSLKHELRTPLNQIIGYTEMLIEEAQDKKQETFIPDLERIHAAGRRLLTVVDDLFDSAQTPDKKLDESYLQHELRTPLNQIIGYTEMLQEEATEKSQQPFISDFQRIHTAARELLDLLIQRVVGVPGQGKPSLAEEASGPTTFIRAEAPTLAKAWLQAAIEPGVLLVVDDNEPNRDMLARRLERLGHKVARAENGHEALQRIKAEPFDLLLLDIMMPVMDGYQVLEQLKADPVLRSLPVIVLSASDESESVVQCIQMGAEDHISKPFDPILLQARINACLEKKRFRDREVSYLQQIQDEKQRTDDLLHIILPRDVAAELKATNAVKPRRFENVGVLFCDIVGFTAFSEGHSPEELLADLQMLVEEFEKITACHSLEKIKTVGDAFMATAGLLAPLRNPALNCIRAGLEMVAAAKTVPPHWQVRVGVHVGPVIAGVVGRKKYQYDVWGDTVNTAARMEQAATPGSICVTAETWKKLRGHCRGHCHGLIQVKGKGDLELFQVDALLEKDS